MRGGDISNEVPMRILVTIDCILDRKPAIKKVFGVPIVSQEVTYNRQSLSLFWRFAQKYDFTLELIGYSFSQKEMDDVLEDLDNLGTNPFNYAKAYRVPADVVAELPYRPEVKHVVDTPERGLRYGHWYLDMGAIGGSR